MKRALPAVALLAVLLAAGLFWASSGSGTAPETPAPAAPKRVQAPVPAGRSVYHFTAPTSDEAPEPEPEPEHEAPPRTSLDREVMARFAEASNEATGLMYHQCLRPWRETNEVDDAPLTINLVLNDGRVGDIEVISPFPLPAELVGCMEDAMWSVPFPEAEGHRGEVKLQRSMSLTR
ncbi:MAG: hypothetical protein H6737_28490 [Alphaproteobacteria bacterium]|nr:hypothetical protein [Alphaproteobacteria bacterium]